MRLFSLFIGLGATLMLLSLMVVTRILTAGEASQPDVHIHNVELVKWTPPPPPPPEPEEPPEDLPPPPAAVVPNLAPSADTDAPTIATTDQPVPMELGFEQFAPETRVADLPAPPKPKPPPRPRPPAPPRKSSYQVSELDGKPRVINHPSVSFPRELRGKGIRQGQVVVVVKISPSGRSSLVRVSSATHPAFKAAAIRVANGSRFTPPKKNGQPVTAVMTWPIVIR